MDTVYLIDFQSIARPIFESNVNGDVTRTSGEIVQRIRNITSGRLHAGLCCDSGRSWRKDVAPDYKANRKETPPSYAHQLSEAVDTLKLDGYPVWTQEGFEADDIIAACINWFPVEEYQAQFVVVSGDKDMHQIVSDIVTVRRPAFQKYPDLDFTPQTVMDKYGLEPKQLVDYFALVGDASDNIRGAEGIGEKTAVPLLATFRTLDAALLAAKETPERFKPGTLKSLLEFAPRADTVRQLIRLRTEGCTIDFSAILTPRTPLDVAEFDGAAEDIDFAMPLTVTNQQLAESLAADVKTAEPPIEAPKPEPKALEPPSGVCSIDPIVPPPTPKKPEPVKFNTAAMVPYEPSSPPVVQVGRYLQPRNLQDANNLSKAVALSRVYSNMAGNDPSASNSALVKMVAGDELGIPPMASLRAFHEIEGQLALAASAIHSAILRAPVVEYFYCKERTDKSATFVGKRKGDRYPELSVTYTVEDAARAWSKDKNKFLLSGWGKNPADMCVARSLTKLGRLICPDVLEGHYAKEEFDE